MKTTVSESVLRRKSLFHHMAHSMRPTGVAVESDGSKMLANLKLLTSVSSSEKITLNKMIFYLHQKSGDYNMNKLQR